MIIILRLGILELRQKHSPKKVKTFCVLENFYVAIKAALYVRFLYLCRMILFPFFIGAPEVFVILLIVVMLFGADKIPEIARGLGKGMRQIKDATNEIKREINDSAVKNDIDTSLVQDIKKDISELNDNIDDLTGPIKRNR
jgi:sec-independent protein translocase protein TatA